MAKNDVNRKKERTLQFLNSLINRRIRSMMARRGFDNEELAFGWRLLGAAAGQDVKMEESRSPLDGEAKKLLANIDEWENTWYPVADATLGFAYPDVRDKLLLNLHMTSGPQLLLNVGTLLERLDELEQSPDETDRAAIALLSKRGLDPARRAAAQALVDQGRSLDFDSEPSPTEQELQRRQDAVSRMWQWTKSWSEIARTVVQDKRLRIHMGISQVARNAQTDLEFDPDVEIVDDADLDSDTDADLDTAHAAPNRPATPESPAASPTPNPAPQPVP